MGVNIFCIVYMYEMIRSHQNIILLRIGTRSGATAFYKHKHTFLRSLECSIGSLAFQARESLEILEIYKQNLMAILLGMRMSRILGELLAVGTVFMKFQRTTSI